MQRRGPLAVGGNRTGVTFTNCHNIYIFIYPICYIVLIAHYSRLEMLKLTVVCDQ